MSARRRLFQSQNESARIVLHIHPRDDVTKTDSRRKKIATSSLLEPSNQYRKIAVFMKALTLEMPYCAGAALKLSMDELIIRARALSCNSGTEQMYFQISCLTSKWKE